MKQFYIKQIGTRPGSSMIITNHLGEFTYHILGTTGFVGAKFRLMDRQGHEYCSLVQTSLGLFPRFALHQNNQHFGSFGLSLYTDAIIYITGANWLTWVNALSNTIQIRNIQHQLAFARPEQNIRYAVQIYDDEDTQTLLLTIAFLIRWRLDHSTQHLRNHLAINSRQYATKLNLSK